MLTGRNGRDSSIFAVESHLLIGNVSVQCHINRPAAFRNGLQGGQWLAQAPLVDPVVGQHLLGEVAGFPDRQAFNEQDRVLDPGQPLAPDSILPGPAL